MTDCPKRDPQSKFIGSGCHQFRSNRLSADKVSIEEAIEEEVVGATGFEPATSSSQSWRSSQAELRSDPRQAIIRSQKRTKAKVFFQIVRGSGASGKQGLGVAPYWATMVPSDDAFVFHLGRAFAAGFGGGDLGTLARAHDRHGTL